MNCTPEYEEDEYTQKLLIPISLEKSEGNITIRKMSEGFNLEVNLEAFLEFVEELPEYADDYNDGVKDEIHYYVTFQPYYIEGPEKEFFTDFLIEDVYVAFSKGFKRSYSANTCIWDSFWRTDDAFIIEMGQFSKTSSLTYVMDADCEDGLAGFEIVLQKARKFNSNTGMIEAEKSYFFEFNNQEGLKVLGEERNNKMMQKEARALSKYPNIKKIIN